MTAYSILVAAHGAIGAIALVTFWAAAALRKGSPAHRRFGQAYLLAMLGILVTAVPMALVRYAQGQVYTAVFLGYLVAITANGVWAAWRAIRDKHDVARYTGPVYVASGMLALLAGLGVLALGLRDGSPLFIGFSAIGLYVGYDTLNKRLHRQRLAARPRWWLIEHYSAMLGNAIATHIAFLGIGLPRLLPAVDGTALHYVAWFGPLLAAVIAKVLLDRKYAAPRRGAAPATALGGESSRAA
ncbi:hypothetical protein LVB77_01685 [Lysobacter sp. 5GHs7-4]|uniref:hypothetical protein n=1 Tax=Lysobacter sp. 5GHs7-4 TaxID=2904253 RepID=UPI001E32BB7B|nr:hypothetical protein [Lysobacter sp. 5GHs7-4]UHQ23451.1 hypothetical protein LVB77_01685 [Lysobacter sp. 5GHs7-4]